MIIIHSGLVQKQYHRFMYLPAILLLTLAVASGPANAEADGPDYWMVVGLRADSTLTIRDAPRRDAPKVGALRHDARGIENLGCVGEPTLEEWRSMSEAERATAKSQRWCRVRYRDIDGWAAGRHLAEDTRTAVSVPRTPGTR
jgi:hypothetical protein